MKIICSICARGGSEGVKNKNIKLMNGKPLIVWSIEQAFQSKFIDKVIISTDSEAISKIASKAGADVPSLRPENLSGNNVEKFLVMKHIFEVACKFYKKEFDYLIDLDCTNPLRDTLDIDQMLEYFHENRDLADMILTITEARKNPYFNLLERNPDGYLNVCIKDKDNIIRRQDAPSVLEHVASIYIMKSEYLKNSNSLFDGKVLGYDIGQEKSFDIDNKFDWDLISYLLRKKNAKK